MDRTTHVWAASYHSDVLDLPGEGSLPDSIRTCELTVRAVFRHAWHLQTAKGWVISVTTAPFNGPLAIRLDRPSLQDLRIEPGMKGYLRPREIVIGRVRLSLDHAVAWAPRPWNQRRGVAEGLISPVEREGERGVEGHWPPRLRSRIEALHQALITLDQPSAHRYALSILGLGPGLTPSGDDVLVGLLAGLFVLGHRVPVTPALDIIPAFSASIMEAAPARTTALSRTLLHYAARGVAVEPLLDVLRVLLLPGRGNSSRPDEPLGSLRSEEDEHRSPPAGAESLQALLAIGHSSGRDMLAGAGLARDAVMRWEEMRGATLARPA